MLFYFAFFLMLFNGCSSAKFDGNSGRGPASSDRKKRSPSVLETSGKSTFESYNFIYFIDTDYEKAGSGFKSLRPIHQEIDSFLTSQKQKGHNINVIGSDGNKANIIFGSGILSPYADLAAAICPAGQSKILSTFNFGDFKLADEVLICNKSLRNDKLNPILNPILNVTPTIPAPFQLSESNPIDRIDTKIPTIILLVMREYSIPNATKIYDMNWFADTMITLSQQFSSKFKIIILHDVKNSRCPMAEAMLGAQPVLRRTAPIEGAEAFVNKTKALSIDVCNPNWFDAASTAVNDM